MAGAERERQTVSVVPRLRFDLLAQLSLGSSNVADAVLDSRPTGSEPEDRGDDLATILPRVHPQSARDAGSDTRSSPWSGDQRHMSNLVQTARIRFAPPPPTVPKHSRQVRTTTPPIRSRHVAPESNSSQQPMHSKRDGSERSSGVPTHIATQKQVATAQCFEALRRLRGTSLDGGAKVILDQVVSVLVDAVYAAKCSKDHLPESESSSASGSIDCVRPGSEYFSLLAAAHETLRQLDAQVVELGTKVAMEKAIESEFESHLRQLTDDLERIQQAHATSGEQIDGELAAVAQLELEYNMLLSHEQACKRECEALGTQSEKQEAQLAEVRAKAAYLEYVSHAPMKKHLDEKKRRDQEAVLRQAARHVEDENAVLEAELAKLNAQVAAVEQQRQRDLDKTCDLESALRESEGLRERHECALRQTRKCHTPRPLWDDIVDQTPELLHQKFEWETTDDVDSDDDARLDLVLDAGGNDIELGSCSCSRGGNGPHSRESGRTKKLVKEMLHWIERLQKHIGVNLHLSRVRP